MVEDPPPTLVLGRDRARATAVAGSPPSTTEHAVDVGVRQPHARPGQPGDTGFEALGAWERHGAGVGGSDPGKIGVPTVVACSRSRRAKRSRYTDCLALRTASPCRRSPRRIAQSTVVGMPALPAAYRSCI